MSPSRDKPATPSVPESPARPVVRQLFQERPQEIFNHFVFVCLFGWQVRNGSAQLMTRKQLTDPLGQLEDEEDCSPVPSSSPQKQPRPSPAIESRPVRSESAGRIQRDSQVPSLLSLTSPTAEETKASSISPSARDPKTTEDLKERARKLIEQTKREAAAASSSSAAAAKSLSKQGSQVCPDGISSFLCFAFYFFFALL